MEEIWKSFHNIEVSNLGNIKTPTFKDGTYTGYNCRGYKHVVTYIKPIQYKHQVHRLVSHLFKDFDLDSNLQINHINHNPSDNRVENLEIVSQRENVQKRKITSTGHLYGTTRMKRLIKNPWASHIHDKKAKQYILVLSRQKKTHTMKQ